ncbi:MAG: hypothetical protein Q9160_000262 [Pyrenula sp. 1 TL-2023]
MSMTTFHAVNSSTPSKDAHMDDTSDVTTPTTPRAVASQIPHPPDPAISNVLVRTANATPTQSTEPPSSQNSLANTSSQIMKSDLSQGTVPQDASQRSTHTSVPDEMDLDGSEDDQDGSGDDTEGGESGRPSKKKKGQRFFCTEFPPCNLSFTRSEHLARHISTQANDPFNAIVIGVSHASIISGNMLKRCTLTKKSPAIPWLQQGLGFNGKFGLIEFGRQVEPVREPPAARLLMAEAIAVISPPRVLVRRLQISVPSKRLAKDDLLL